MGGEDRDGKESAWQNHTTGEGYIETVNLFKPKVDVIGNIVKVLGINTGVKEVLFNQSKFGDLSKSIKT